MSHHVTVPRDNVHLYILSVIVSRVALACAAIVLGIACAPRADAQSIVIMSGSLQSVRVLSGRTPNNALTDTAYRVSGDYVIRHGGKLVISPSALVQFLPNSRIVDSVGGKIIAVGTQDGPITFECLAINANAIKLGNFFLILPGADSAVFRNCHFTYCRKDIVAYCGRDFSQTVLHILCSAVVQFDVSPNDIFKGSGVAVPPSGSTFPVGLTPVSLTWSDALGNTAAAMFNVVVLDTLSPTFQYLAPIVLSCGEQVPPPSPALIAAFDNCSADVTWEGDAIDNAFPQLINRTYLATDPSGNSTTVVQTIWQGRPSSPICGNDINVAVDRSACGAAVSFGTDTKHLFMTTGFDSYLYAVDPADWSEFRRINISSDIGWFSHTDGMAQDPTTGSVYVILSDVKPGRPLATLDLVTGVAHVIGFTNEYIAALAFSSDGTLYGISAAPDIYAASFPSYWPTNIKGSIFNKLVTINKSTAVVSPVVSVSGNSEVGSDVGQALAYDSDDGMLYHWFFGTGNSLPVMERIDPVTHVVTGVPMSGDITSSLITAATYAGRGSFYAADYGGHGPIFSVTTAGVGTKIALVPNGIAPKGLILDRLGVGTGAPDHCAIALAQTSGLPSGSVFPVGTTTNTYIMKDPSGSTSTCSFNVTVIDNEPPVITPPSDIMRYADKGICGAAVDLGKPIATDNCGLATVSNDWSGGVFPVGTTAVNWTATDIHGNVASGTQRVTIIDTVAPVLDVPANRTQGTDWNQMFATVSYSLTATDNCAARLCVVPTSGSQFGLGTTTVTATAVDPSGNKTVKSFTVTVVDNQPPELVVVQPSQCLWPPNHKYVAFTIASLIASAIDNVDGSVIGNVKITKVTSDEVDNSEGTGSGNTAHDIVIGSDCRSVQLRTERNGTGNGRIYTIYFAVRDAAGNTGTASCIVCVPHDQSGAMAVNDGTKWTATGQCSSLAKDVDADLRDAGRAGLVPNPDDNPIHLTIAPNPFSNTAEIIFEVPLEDADQLVELKVFDIAGHDVSSLVHEARATGRYTSTFNASGLRSGQYVAAVHTATHMQSKMMILIR